MNNIGIYRHIERSKLFSSSAFLHGRPSSRGVLARSRPRAKKMTMAIELNYRYMHLCWERCAKLDNAPRFQGERPAQPIDGSIIHEDDVSGENSGLDHPASRCGRALALPRAGRRGARPKCRAMGRR